MRSIVNRIYEADLAFRAPGSVAVTAGAVIGSPIKLDKMAAMRTGAQRNKLASQSYEIVVVVSALDRTTGDETYTFTVETGGASPAVKVAELTGITKAGQYVITIDAATIEALDATHTHIELNLAVAGTTPSITFAAWLAQGW